MSSELSAGRWFVAGVFVACAAPWALGAGAQPPLTNYGYTFNGPQSGELNGRRNVVVISHGWRSSPSDWSNGSSSPAGLGGMRPLIIEALGEAAADWDVWALDWEMDAAADSPSDFAPGLNNMMRAQMQGHHVARALLDQGTYDHVHLIGHSLGGRVIESAATLLSQAGDAPTIHTTFLDAYTPTAWDSVFGSTSTWSEHYYNRNTGPTFNPNDAFFTESNFPHAANFDITGAQDPMEDGYAPGLISWNHNWPQRFYRRSVEGADEATAPYGGLGYRLSAEHRGEATEAPGFHRQTVRTLAADGTVSAPTAIDGRRVENRRTLDPSAGGGLVVKSERASAIDGVLEFDASSGLGSWARFTFTTTAPVNFIEFEFAMDAIASDGLLTLFTETEDVVRFQANNLHRLGGFESTGKITQIGFEEVWAPGVHTLAFRYDTTSDVGDAWVRNIQLGLLTVPAPGGAAALSAFGAIAAMRRRR